MNKTLNKIIEGANLYSSNVIINLIAGNMLLTSIEDKKYFIDNYSRYIDLMDNYDFIKLIKLISKELFESCSEYFLKRINELSYTEIESILYVNKYERRLSDIAPFLLEQPGFKDKYPMFLVAYELETHINDDSFSLSKLNDFGDVIISALSNYDGDTILFDRALKNYTSILMKNYPELYEEFKKRGYACLRKMINDGVELTNNVIIFDCRMIANGLKNTIVNYCEFYPKINNENAFACADLDSVMISIERIKNSYSREEDKRFVSCYIIFTIAHEICHMFHSQYDEEKNADDPITKLSIFNAKMGEATQHANRDLYALHHDSFAHEFLCNIEGMKHLYDVQRCLQIKDEEFMQKLTRYFAGRLLASNCFDTKTNKYIGPVEVTRKFFSESKYIPKYAQMTLFHGKSEMPPELETIEKELTEKEKFMLGYFSKYINVLDLVGMGTVKSTNLFEDLDRIYDTYSYLLGDKYFNETSNDSKSK